MRGQYLGEGARVVVHRPDGIGDQMRDRAGILVVVQQIRRDAARAGDGQAPQVDPLGGAEGPLVEAHIWSSALATHRQGEVMSVRRQVPEPVEGGCRPVRHHALLWDPLPGRRLRGQLQPRCPQLDMVGNRRPYDSVDAVSDAFENRAVSSQPCERSRGNAGNLLGLATGDQAPLVLGDLAETSKGRSACHYCNLPHTRGMLQRSSLFATTLYGHTDMDCSTLMA